MSDAPPPNPPPPPFDRKELPPYDPNANWDTVTQELADHNRRLREAYQANLSFDEVYPNLMRYFVNSAEKSMQLLMAAFKIEEEIEEQYSPKKLNPNALTSGSSDANASTSGAPKASASTSGATEGTASTSSAAAIAQSYAQAKGTMAPEIKFPVCTHGNFIPCVICMEIIGKEELERYRKKLAQQKNANRQPKPRKSIVKRDNAPHSSKETNATATDDAAKEKDVTPVADNVESKKSEPKFEKCLVCERTDHSTVNCPLLFQPSLRKNRKRNKKM